MISESDFATRLEEARTVEVPVQSEFDKLKDESKMCKTIDHSNGEPFDPP